MVAWFRRPALWAAAVVIGLAGIGLTAYYTLFDRHQPRENTGVVKTVVTPDQPSLGVTAPSAPANLPRPAPAATDSAVDKGR